MSYQRIIGAIPVTLIAILFTAQIGSSIPSDPDIDISCELRMAPPELQSTHSSRLIAASAGEEFVLATIASTNCTSGDIPFAALIEVRNSKGMTENLGWQSGILEENGQIQIGVSWIPAHGDNYEIRSFAITDFVNPEVLSNVSISHVEIAEAKPTNE